MCVCVFNMYFIQYFILKGLFTGLIVQHYGPRRCGIIGAILFSGGLIASAFASSTTYLIITIGILTGILSFLMSLYPKLQLLLLCLQILELLYSLTYKTRYGILVDWLV